MAKVTDPNFAGFDAALFRTAIRSTMTMAAPNGIPQRATFRWSSDKTYNPQDPAHNPYSFTETPVTDVEHPDVQVPVAVEFTALRSASNDTVVGEFDTARAIVTLLDVDYVLIEGADQILLGENTYLIEFVAPPVALFEVDVYRIYAQARDES